MLLVVSEPHATVVAHLTTRPSLRSRFGSAIYQIRPGAAPGNPAGERNGAYRDATRSDLRRGE
jgi:hypothetical protein